MEADATTDPTGASRGEAKRGDGVPVGTLIKLALAAALIAVVVIFVLQNLDSVPVDFLSWDFEMPLILLLAIAAAVGIVARSMVSFWRSRR